MATSKATFEKRIKDLEASLAQAASENSKLKKSLEKQEEEWKTRLATAESKLGESEGKLQSITTELDLWLRLYGVCFDNLCLSSSFILDILCIFHNLLLLTFYFRSQKPNCCARPGNSTPEYPDSPSTTILCSWACTL